MAMTEKGAKSIIQGDMNDAAAASKIKLGTQNAFTAG